MNGLINHLLMKIIHTYPHAIIHSYNSSNQLKVCVYDFTIYLFDTHTSCYATFEESWCVEHYSL